MYSLDINFLKDREDYLKKPDNRSDNRRKDPQGNMTPLILGVIIGLLFPGMVGGLWFYLQQQNAQLTQDIADIDQQLASQQAERNKIKELDDQIKTVDEETKALATVFNQIKPWSAMLEDIRQRIPAGVQLTAIEQSEAEPSSAPQPQPSPAASPSPGATTPAPSTPQLPINLRLSGQANSFDDVNYFLLTLQRSPFFKSDETQIVSAQLEKNPDKLEVNVRNNQGESSANVKYELPQVVNYTIQTTLSDVPAEELLRELDRKGAVGLVTRIRTLQQITQETPATNPPTDTTTTETPKE